MHIYKVSRSISHNLWTTTKKMKHNILHGYSYIDDLKKIMKQIRAEERDGHKICMDGSPFTTRVLNREPLQEGKTGSLGHWKNHIH